MSKQEELLNILEKKKIITGRQINEAKSNASRSGLDVEKFLIEKNIVDPEIIAENKAEVYKMDYQNFHDKQINEDALGIISSEVAENYKVVCLKKSGNKMKIGITDPDNFKALEAINFLAKKEGLQVEYSLISELSFDKVYKLYRDLKKEVGAALETKAKEEKDKEKKEKNEDQLEEIIKSAPVSKIVSVIIRHAVEGRASDIHIEPLKNECRVRYRIDGILHTSLILPKNVLSAIVARIKVLSNLKLDETRIPQDGRIRLIINKKAIDFRVSILPLVGEEKVVMRILDISRGAPTLEELGYNGRSLEVINRNIKKTNGMFLVTGPTGSGKSTTLFAILNILNKEGVNISTLEDPVEYFIKGINQSQVRPEIGFSFVNGLRSILRQDPDIVMVGEIRDNETAELAIHASLTGHLVLATLHTNNAIGAVPRLLDMKVEPFLLGSTLCMVAAQRLARRICSNCKQEEKMPDNVLNDIANELNNMPKNVMAGLIKEFKDIKNIIYYKGKGCPRCGNLGYKGRVSIVEVLEIDDKIKEMIINEDKILQIKKSSQDFITMKQDGIIKVIHGITTMEEVLRVMQD